MELQGRVKELRKRGLNVAAISYDPVSVLADFAGRRHITFPLLSDTGSATITRYGILNTTVSSTDRLRGLPFPGTFILDRRGVVTARFFEAELPGARHGGQHPDAPRRRRIGGR